MQSSVKFMWFSVTGADTVGEGLKSGVGNTNGGLPMEARHYEPGLASQLAEPGLFYGCICRKCIFYQYQTLWFSICNFKRDFLL
jgi:hypothetical protein